MKNLSDQTCARLMLEIRNRGYSFGFFYRRSAKRYLLLFAGFAVCLVMLALLEYSPGFWLMLGMLAGCLLRDISWVRGYRHAWPFTHEITDWGKVQRLADGKPSE